MSYGFKRCFEDYVPNKLTSQPRPLHALEERGFEKGDARILTTSQIGVPVTIFLLVIREAIESIRDEQDDLKAAHGVLGTYSADEFEDQYKLAIARMFPGLEFRETLWEHSTPWAQNDSISISGCTAYQQTHLLRPVPASGTDLDAAIVAPLEGVKAYKTVGRWDQPNFRNVR